MTIKELNDWLSTSSYDYSGPTVADGYEPLISLLVHYDCAITSEYDTTEVTVAFAVPIKWLEEYLFNLTQNSWTERYIRQWLQNEYTSDDSRPILEQAVSENKLAFWKIC